MLFKTFVATCLFSLGFFTVMAMTGAKGPRFDFGSGGGSYAGGRGSTGYHSTWHGGK